MSKESEALEIPIWQRTYSNKQKAEKDEIEKGLGGPLEVFIALAIALYGDDRSDKMKK